MITTFKTETGSTYTLNHGNQTLMRNLPPEEDRLEGSSTLRRDTEPIQILATICLGIGVPAEFYLNVREDGIPTYRITSNVVDINVED